MSEAHNRLGLLLDELQRVLMDVGWWSSQMPDQQKMASRTPFCVDTLAFEEWLQWIFLPRMRQILQKGDKVPAALLVPMAEQSFGESRAAIRVLQVLRQIDRLIAGLQGCRPA